MPGRGRAGAGGGRGGAGDAVPVRQKGEGRSGGSKSSLNRRRDAGDAGAAVSSPGRPRPDLTRAAGGRPRRAGTVAVAEAHAPSLWGSRGPAPSTPPRVPEHRSCNTSPLLSSASRLLRRAESRSWEDRAVYKLPLKPSGRIHTVDSVSTPATARHCPPLPSRALPLPGHPLPRTSACAPPHSALPAHTRRSFTGQSVGQRRKETHLQLCSPKGRAHVYITP